MASACSTMDDDAYYLIVHTHGKLLRSMATCLGVHCEGLQQAGRIAKARKLISTKQARRLAHFDITYNLMRHISSVSAGKFCMDILSSVAAVGAEGVPQPSDYAAVDPPVIDDMYDMNDKYNVASAVAGGAEGQVHHPEEAATDVNTISGVISGLIESSGSRLEEKLIGKLQEATLTIANLRQELNSTREQTAEVLKAVEVRRSAVGARVSAHEAALGWPKGAT
eukprot:TRINITY_DN24408_c0_g1_i1.p1 TRINITY_DN24408_c0_g1~~TRINITY_DN24408_c0_g1_i1.p1  ORF type:complete len:224 (-),score=54.86 TRINITY_DN24408_c0_g1_i1:12-683(-)